MFLSCALLLTPAAPPVTAARLHPVQDPTEEDRDQMRSEIDDLRRRLAEIETRTGTPEVDAPAPEGGEGVQWKDLIRAGSRFRLYGLLRLDAMRDDSRPNNSQTIGWILSEDPAAPPGVGAGGENREHFTMHPRLTRLGVDFDGGAVEAFDARLAGKVEIDFYNNGLAGQSESRSAIRMRHAWLQLAWERFSLLAGQAYDVISPLYPIVNADLVMWGAGNLGDRRPQLRGEYRFGSGDGVWTVQTEIGLTGADDNADVDPVGTFGSGYRDGEASGLPTLQARVAYRRPVAGQELELGVWGHRAWEDPDGTFAGRSEFDSEAVGIDFHLPLWRDKVGLKLEAWTGENLDDVRGGIFQGINATTGEEIGARGGFAEIGWKVTPNYSLAAGYSTDDPDDGDLNPGGRAENRIWYLANRWSFSSLHLGIEYLHWTTEYLGFDEGDDDRFVGFIQYSF